METPWAPWAQDLKTFEKVTRGRGAFRVRAWESRVSWGCVSTGMFPFRKFPQRYKKGLSSIPLQFKARALTIGLQRAGENALPHDTICYCIVARASAGHCSPMSPSTLLEHWCWGYISVLWMGQLRHRGQIMCARTHSW